jgi:light-regulated signal transduction histidine kinase (bacteriophytochrome)
MAIDGFSQILLDECRGRVVPAAMEHLQYICKATRRMHELTTDLMNLARASRAQLRRGEVDLSILARGIIQDLRVTQPGRAVSVTVADGMIVNGDIALLRIALENLLNNAWKFTSRTSAAEVEVGMANGGAQRVYYVRDNGAGFDMAAAGKLFSTFERLHSAHEFPGTGIGLSTVQRIIRRHGGQIRAEGAIGRGAAFYFDLGAADRREASH